MKNKRRKRKDPNFVQIVLWASLINGRQGEDVEEDDEDCPEPNEPEISFTICGILLSNILDKSDLELLLQQVTSCALLVDPKAKVTTQEDPATGKIKHR